MSSPSQPVPIRSPRRKLIDNGDDVSGTPQTQTPLAGTPTIQALRAQYAATGTPPMPNIPRPAFSSLQPDIPSSYRTQILSGVNPGASGTATPLDLENLPDEEKAKVIARHLVLREERQNSIPPAPGLDTPRPTSSARDSASCQNSVLEREVPEPFPIPYDTPGADVTHDIYKWHADKSKGRLRAVSFAGPSQPLDPAFEHIHEPGGFRRNYVLLRASEQGIPDRPVFLNNFIDFLFLYGHFAGEDLEEDEDEKEDDVEQHTVDVDDSQRELPAEETSPLLNTHTRTRSSRSRRRASSIGPRGGTVGVTQAALMMLKAFVGTGIMFLGKGFYNGGLVFSAVTFVLIALISLYSFLLLVKAKFVVSGSFGDIGGELYGPWMRYTILASIVVSQIGFCAAYTIFVAQNFQAVVLGITNCLKVIPVTTFILAQIVVFLPLALIRDIAKLGTTVLVADVFILAGLVYIFGSEFNILAENGMAEVQWFNPKSFSLFIGTAVFSFEGIGLVIPITDSMKEPHKFPRVLTGVMALLTVLFGGAGALGYLTFGSDVQTVILVNLDQSNPTVLTVQFFYALAILLSCPLQLFPAVRIMENGLFTRSGKMDVRVKWSKNMFRFSMVALNALISWYGAADLDKFVALVGCFACVPLCYVYPAMLHYRACARTRKQKLADIAMVVFGLVTTVFTTVQTIQLMMTPDVEPQPIGNCKP